MKFSGVTILQGVEFSIFPIDFKWALQQCSATALPVMGCHVSGVTLQYRLKESVSHRRPPAYSTGDTTVYLFTDAQVVYFLHSTTTSVTIRVSHSSGISLLNPAFAIGNNCSATQNVCGVSSTLWRHLVNRYEACQTVCNIKLKWCFLTPTRTYQTYNATPPTFLIWNNLCDLVYQQPTRSYRSQTAVA